MSPAIAGLFVYKPINYPFSRIDVDSMSIRCRIGLELVIVLAFAFVLAIAQVFVIVLENVFVVVKVIVIEVVISRCILHLFLKNKKCIFF